LPGLPPGRKGRRLDLCQGFSPSPFKIRKDKRNAEERMSNSDFWLNCRDRSEGRSVPGATRGRPNTGLCGGVHFRRQVAYTQRLPQVGLGWRTVDTEWPERRQRLTFPNFTMSISRRRTSKRT
jgi:hypothetical protein